MPAAIARFRPSPVRSRIRSRSKSAMAAKSVDNSRPCELDVSHGGSPSDRNAVWRCSGRGSLNSGRKIQMSFMLMMAHGTVTVISPMW